MSDTSYDPSLRACPRCGRPAYIYTHAVPPLPVNGTQEIRYHVHCSGSGCVRLGPYDTAEAARAAWNEQWLADRRPSPPPEEHAAAREQHDRLRLAEHRRALSDLRRDLEALMAFAQFAEPMVSVLPSLNEAVNEARDRAEMILNKIERHEREVGVLEGGGTA